MAMFPVSGCAQMLESVFFLNFKPFGVCKLAQLEDSRLSCRKCGDYF